MLQYTPSKMTLSHGDVQTLLVQVADQVLMRNVSQVDTYCLRATGGAVAVTLAWADYPCDLSAAICLVRRL